MAHLRAINLLEKKNKPMGLTDIYSLTDMHLVKTTKVVLGKLKKIVSSTKYNHFASYMTFTYRPDHMNARCIMGTDRSCQKMEVLIIS